MGESKAWRYGRRLERATQKWAEMGVNHVRRHFYRILKPKTDAIHGEGRVVVREMGKSIFAIRELGGGDFEVVTCTDGAFDHLAEVCGGSSSAGTPGELERIHICDSVEYRPQLYIGGE
jgi:hypothetical protein